MSTGHTFNSVQDVARLRASQAEVSICLPVYLSIYRSILQAKKMVADMKRELDEEKDKKCKL